MSDPQHWLDELDDPQFLDDLLNGPVEDDAEHTTLGVRVIGVDGMQGWGIVDSSGNFHPGSHFDQIHTQSSSNSQPA